MKLRRLVGAGRKALLLLLLLSLCICFCSCGREPAPASGAVAPGAPASPAEFPAGPAADTPDPPSAETEPAAEPPAPAASIAAPDPPAPSPAPVPAPAPAPVTAPAPHTCTISISCAPILSHLSEGAQEKVAILPENGVILGVSEREFAEGDTVFDVLLAVCQEKQIHLEFSETPLYHSMYIEGIANLYEFDFGDMSGWTYTVNGVQPNVGCSSCPVAPGDSIVWIYSRDFVFGE